MNNNELREAVSRAAKEIYRPRPRCRDCADDGPICPGSGMPCDPEERAVVIILTELTPLLPAPEPVDDKVTAAALRLIESKSGWQNEGCCAALDVLGLGAPAGDDDAAQVYDAISDILARGLRAAQQEAAELREWKRQQLEVEATWSVQAVGKLLDVPLGKSIRPEIAPGIEALQAEVTKLREALGDIAKQKTADELNTDHVALLGDFGVHDFESAYDLCIKTAREAIEGKR